MSESKGKSPKTGYKNIFDIADKPVDSNRIIEEDESLLVGEMLQELIKLHRTITAEGQYNSVLAQRIIFIYFKHEKRDELHYDVVDQIDTLVDYLCKSQEFEDIMRATDLLNLFEMQELDFKLTKKWKVKCLAALREHYFRQRKPAEARKVNACIIAQLTGLLKRSDLFVHTQLYSYCVRQLLQCYKLNLKRAEKKGKHLEATEQLGLIVSLIEKCDQTLRATLQSELMSCYYKLGEENRELHYQSYSQKYFLMAYNIAVRTKDPFSKTINAQINRN